MKRMVVAVAWMIFGSAWLQPVMAEETAMTAAQILEKSDAAARSDSSKGVMETVIVTTGGDKRTLVSEAYSKNGTDKQLTRYIEPARVQGEAMLMLNDGDEIWYYSPRTDRARKIASHAKKKKVMGSDFTYEDMASGTMAEKYTGEVMGEEKEGGKRCFHLTLKPTPKGPSYAKIEVWIDRETFIPLRMDYWNEGDAQPFKRLILSDIRDEKGHWTPMNYVMTNLKENSETIMRVKEIAYDMDLDDTLFTVQNLKKR